MRITILAMEIALLSLVAPIANAEENLSIQEVLSIAKLAGVCGVFKQMAAFQEATQLEGGHVFAARFLMTEAARLGKTPEEYVTQCNRAIAAYERLRSQ